MAPYKISAHAASLTKGHPAAQLARRRARAAPASSSAGRTSSTSASTPTAAREYHDETLPKEAHKVAHFCSMCGPKFCSMKITADVRDDAAGLSDNEKAALYPDAAKQGMADMSKKFIDMGAEVYVDKAQAVKESNKSL